MSKQVTKWIKWPGLTLLLVLSFWFAYDLHFKFIVNDYQAKQIEQRLQDNFKANQDNFDDLLIFSKQLGNLKYVVFGANRQVSFQVDDSLLDRTNVNYTILSIGENSIYGIQDIDFLDSNAIEITVADEVKTHYNWTIDFKGKMDDLLMEKSLAYLNITGSQLKELERKLNKIDCIGFDQSADFITIRYAGHAGESYNYIIPRTSKIVNENWIQLSDNYYWEHYRNGLFCGWTDW